MDVRIPAVSIRTWICRPIHHLVVVLTPRREEHSGIHTKAMLCVFSPLSSRRCVPMLPAYRPIGVDAHTHKVNIQEKNAQRPPRQ